MTTKTKPASEVPASEEGELLKSTEVARLLRVPPWRPHCRRRLGSVQADRGAAFEMLVFAILHASTLADSVASRPSRGEPRGSSTCNDGR